MAKINLGATSLAFILAVGVGSANAGKENDTLTWASNSDPSNLDWYQHTLREAIIIGHHVWDSLIYRNLETGEYEPHLAKSFKWIDDTTLEFVLREGITFHNGEEFNADDVVYTVEWVTNPENTVIATNRIFYLEGAEKIDDYTVRIHMKEPFPPALDYIANGLMIYPNEYYAEVGPDGMARKPVGTGPYEVTEIQPGEEITMEINEDYFGGAKGQPNIGTLVFRPITEFNTQAIELVTGGLDWIWRVPPDAAEDLTGQPGLTVTSGETMRIGFLNMDAAGRSGDTPLTELKVRQAINHAINREGIRRELMGGKSRVINVPCAPMQFGCIDDSATVYEYDPEKARELLAEAGYEDGFSIDFYVYRDRPVAEAIIGNLREVGIDTNMQFMQSSALQPLRQKGQIPLLLQAWGSSSISDMTASTGNFFRHGAFDFARDDEVLAMFEEGRTMDQEKRVEVYEQLLARISEQAYTVPLFTYTYNYAFIDELNFEPSADEIARFWDASWKEE